MAVIVDDIAVEADDAYVDEPLTIRSHDTEANRRLLGAAVASLCLTWLVYERLTPLSGGVGFVLVWYLTFVALAWWVTRTNDGVVVARDRVARIVIWSGGLALLIPLVAILLYVAGRGYHALHWSFFTDDERYVGSMSSAKAGGAAHAIIGTLEQVGIAMALSVPLAVATAIYLNEVGGRLAWLVRAVVDAMSALPTIVAGLFIFTAYIITFHQTPTGFAGGLALAVMMLPTVTRTSEIVLRLVPGGLREAGVALGGTDARTTRLVILPTARGGLATAVILGIARVIGETAPLLLTIGVSRFTNPNPFHDAQSALPVFVYNIFRSQTNPAQWQRAWTGAFVLILIVLLLFVLARIIGGRGPGHIGRFKRWRLARKGLA